MLLSSKDQRPSLAGQLALTNFSIKFGNRPARLDPFLLNNSGFQGPSVCGSTDGWGYYQLVIHLDPYPPDWTHFWIKHTVPLRTHGSRLARPLTATNLRTKIWNRTRRIDLFPSRLYWLPRSNILQPAKGTNLFNKNLIWSCGLASNQIPVTSRV